MDTSEWIQLITDFLNDAVSTLGNAWDWSRPHLHDGAQWLADLLAG